MVKENKLFVAKIRVFRSTFNRLWRLKMKTEGILPSVAKSKGWGACKATVFCGILKIRVFVSRTDGSIKGRCNRPAELVQALTKHCFTKRLCQIRLSADKTV
jgi:hypothetical protein